MANPPKNVPKKWVRNKADELAVRRGARFDAARGQHFIDIVTANFRLYEGTRFAGKPMELMDWQIDFYMRLFSWVTYSPFLKQWIRRFRRARLWVPKKNGKSPMAAATGLYLTVADGEEGGKTYSAAKDGKQAQIVHDCAIKMVEQSPALRDECQINYTNKRIAHLPTNSFYGVIASDNKDGQEGLNGNAIIDEGHVVDASLAKVLEYMGASRDEPLELMVSTAGKNLMGWGKREWDHGERVNAGEADDPELLHVVYAADQKATDEELEDPKVWHAANPSLGKIINPEVFGRELTAAKSKGPADWAMFKMYRFNIWQTSSSPWIDGPLWQGCADTFKIEDFAGQPVFYGLDGSLSGDMTCLHVIIPVAREDWTGDPEAEEGKRYHLWPLLYITRAAVEKFSDKAPFNQWADRGDLRIVESNQIDYQQVEADAISLAEDHDLSVQCVTYDTIYAAATGQKIADRLGCAHVAFKQSLLEYAEPTDMFERLLKLQLIRHANNLVLNWQAGHVEITVPNRQGWSMPVKPQSTDKMESRQAHASIDGISSAIMGLREARKFKPEAATGYVAFV